MSNMPRPKELKRRGVPQLVPKTVKVRGVCPLCGKTELRRNVGDKTVYCASCGRYAGPLRITVLKNEIAEIERQINDIEGELYDRLGLKRGNDVTDVWGSEKELEEELNRLRKRQATLKEMLRRQQRRK